MTSSRLVKKLSAEYIRSPGLSWGEMICTDVGSFGVKEDQIAEGCQVYVQANCCRCAWSDQEKQTLWLKIWQRILGISEDLQLDQLFDEEESSGTYHYSPQLKKVISFASSQVSVISFAFYQQTYSFFFQLLRDSLDFRLSSKSSNQLLFISLNMHQCRILQIFLISPILFLFIIFTPNFPFLINFLYYENRRCLLFIQFPSLNLSFPFINLLHICYPQRTSPIAHTNYLTFVFNQLLNKSFVYIKLLPHIYKKNFPQSLVKYREKLFFHELLDYFATLDLKLLPFRPAHQFYVHYDQVFIDTGVVYYMQDAFVGQSDVTIIEEKTTFIKQNHLIFIDLYSSIDYFSEFRNLNNLRKCK